MLRDISVSTAGSGLDGGLKVGDKEYLVTDIMGVPTIRPNDSQGKLYVYEFPGNDKDKLVATAKIVNSYFIEYQNISLSNTPTDKKSALKALQEKADLWNLSISLEENVVVQSEDKVLWRWLVQFTDQVGSAIDYHLAYLTGTDPAFKAFSLSEGQKALVNAVSLVAQYQEEFGDL